MTTIRAVTGSCIHSFAVVCHQLEQHAYLDTSCCEDVQEAFGRFRVWTGNLGALAKGHSALDWRLRDADVMGSTVLSLLVELQNTLELASDLARDGNSQAFLRAEIDDNGDVPHDISLPSDDELDAVSEPADGLNHLAPRVQDLVKDLYKLSFRIRNSTSKPARAIYYKEIDASSGLDIFGDCSAIFDRNHILELFGSLRRDHPSLTENDNILVERFARANTGRRRQFRYWQKHAQKLATTESPEPVVPIVAALANREETLKTHTRRNLPLTHRCLRVITARQYLQPLRQLSSTHSWILRPSRHNLLSPLRPQLATSRGNLRTCRLLQLWLSMVKILFVITAMYFARPPTATVALGALQALKHFREV